MRAFLRVGEAVAITVSLAGCSDTPRKAADTIRQAVPALAESSDEDLLGMMEGVCDKVNNLGIIYYVNSMAELGLSDEQARVIGLQSSYVLTSLTEAELI